MAKYTKNQQITQGAIVKDFQIISLDEAKEIKRITLPYCAIISQACDIEQSNDNNGFLPNIMVLPLYVFEIFTAGNHLKKCGYDDIAQRVFSSKENEKLKRNSDYSRYHFLPQEKDFLEHDVVADFKHYYTIPKSLVINQFQDKYIATTDSLYKESLSQRFCNYLGRIGLPA